MKAGWIATLAALCVAATALAQEPPPDRGRPDRPGVERRRGPRRAGPPGFMLERMSRRLAQDLELDEEQAAEFEEIVADFRTRWEDSQPDMAAGRELWEQMREARQSGDEARVQELRERMREMRAGSTALMDEFFDNVATILNEDQLVRLNRHREQFQQMGQRGRGRGPDMRRVLEQLPEQLELDEEQMAQFERMREQLRGQIGDRGEHWQQMRPLMEEMRAAREAGDEQRVAEIRQQLEEMRSQPASAMDTFFADLETILRDDQKARLAEIRASLDAGRQRNRPLDVRAILQAARRLDLNEDQRQTLRDINQRAMRESRALRRSDTAAQADLVRRVRAEITEMLNAEQTQRFEQLLQNDGPRRGARARGDRPGRNREDRGPRPPRDDDNWDRP